MFEKSLTGLCEQYERDGKERAKYSNSNAFERGSDVYIGDYADIGVQRTAVLLLWGL
ncbi:hypothetical protein [Butyrivibrio sp. CB08]|uniref:hypothetical protein n=1 Tax=Butyrivibrio sp. CB08 TaxID=2364879 RepID=UPI0018F7B1F5|nr:hypothetical protein [Butyrivibrio sp. CB08]